MTALETRKEIQKLLGVKPDGVMGKLTDAAYATLDAAPDNAEWPIAGVNSVMASSFADPADIAAFDRCKATGKTDKQCFAVGDNGIGKWGDNTKKGSGPACALPPEDWQPFGKDARKKKVIVSANGFEVVCELRDTMPSREKSQKQNGAGIDLNYDACVALGEKPPCLFGVTWRWA